jgi:toxin ParE1/3/4
MRVRLSPAIPFDLEDILEYIARDSFRYAARTVRRLRAHCTVVAQDPMLYRLRPEIGKGIRLATLGSYVILFRVDRDAVLIERIVNGSRDLVGLLENKQ